jgi:hypothetical protein
MLFPEVAARRHQRVSRRGVRLPRTAIPMLTLCARTTKGVAMSAQDILRKFKNIKRSGDGWTALCPSHDDTRNSLSIGEGDGGRLLLNCHANAGCTFESIVRAAGIAQEGRRRIAATYDYRDEQGNILFQAIRYEPKGFSQRRANGNGWIYKLNGVRRIPYRLPALPTYSRNDA